jgi:hypothetical protein
MAPTKKKAHEKAARASTKLGDFTVGPRTIFIALLAVGIGVISAYVALGLLKLIGIFTNLFFFQRWSTALVSPAGNHLGAYSRARHSGSHRIDTDQRQPGRAQAGHPEAAVVSDLDRLGRSVWR